MSKTDTKAEPKIVGIKFEPEDLEVMQQWANEHRLPLSWVVRRCVEIGLPVFLKNPISAEDSVAAITEEQSA